MINQDSSYSAHFLACAQAALGGIDASAIDRLALTLAEVRERGGRLFLLGVGGSAAHASHATNDFRKICDFEAYCLTDNVAELTARINDEGWEGAFAAWLQCSRLNKKDGLLIFSVGGGSLEPPVSTILVRAMQAAKAKGAAVTGIIGRNGGMTAELADAYVLIPTVEDSLITPLVEGFAAVVWHGLVSHPALNRRLGHWEQVSAGQRLAVNG
jgi:D-sedoheptulose 7-phosphate isomerase